MTPKNPKNIKKMTAIIWFVSMILAILVALGSFFLAHKTGQGILWSVVVVMDLACGIWYLREAKLAEKETIIDNEKLTK